MDFYREHETQVLLRNIERLSTLNILALCLDRPFKSHQTKRRQEGKRRNKIHKAPSVRSCLMRRQARSNKKTSTNLQRVTMLLNLHKHLLGVPPAQSYRAETDWINYSKANCCLFSNCKKMPCIYFRLNIILQHFRLCKMTVYIYYYYS